MCKVSNSRKFHSSRSKSNLKATCDNDMRNSKLDRDRWLVHSSDADCWFAEWYRYLNDIANIDTWVVSRYSITILYIGIGGVSTIEYRIQKPNSYNFQISSFPLWSSQFTDTEKYGIYLFNWLICEFISLFNNLRSHFIFPCRLCRYFRHWNPRVLIIQLKWNDSWSQSS